MPSRNLGTSSNVKKFKLVSNRRSRPAIIKVANEFAKESIEGRLEKEMKPVRASGKPEVVTWKAETAEKEAEEIAQAVVALTEKGFKYGDIAVLFRSVRTSAGPLVAALRKRGIPFECGGRTGLFMQPEVGLFAQIYAWILNKKWQGKKGGDYKKADLDRIVAEFETLLMEKKGGIPGLKEYLEGWKEDAEAARKSVNLVGDFYRFLCLLGAHKLDPNDPTGRTRLGAFARFTQLLADYEHVTRRARWVDEDGKRVFKGAQNRGHNYYYGLYLYLQYYARDAYEDFEGEEAFDTDSVNILTVHQAKGLEWPVVFIPCLSSQRFPSHNSRKAQKWYLPERVFRASARKRYEGGDLQERRLFYVAMTRARDAVYLSTFNRTEKRTAKPSPYLEEIAAMNGGLKSYAKLPVPDLPEDPKEKEPLALEIGFSDIAAYEECGFRFRLSGAYGFQPPLAPEMGYGRAIHHILRHVAEVTREEKKVPTMERAHQIMEREFYLPFANKPGFEEMKRKAKFVLDRYLDAYSADLERVWAIERPFELQVEGGIVSGKADVILDHMDGKPGRLAIVDYKSAKGLSKEEKFNFQIQVYTAAGRGEGLEVAAGYLHDLTDGHRDPVDVGESATKAAVERLGRSVKAVRQGQFPPCEKAGICRSCDYKVICKHSKTLE